MPLTKIQNKIVAFIRNFSHKHGYAPTVREIQQHCGFKSPRAAAYHLEVLEEQGVISRSSKARTVRLASEQGAVPIPVFATIPAGSPQLREPTAPELALNPAAFPRAAQRNLFALRVSGDSMTGAKIFDGDIVIVEPRPAKEGDIVVALVDGESTLKRLIKKNGGYLLKAENPAYPEITPAAELTIQGVVIGVFRSIQS
jgi:repressor LexA